MFFKKLFKTLFVDLGNSYSLRRRFLATWYGAPNRVEGFFAFPIFFIRRAFGKNIEGNYASQIIEKPLYETYSDKIVQN